MVKIAKSATYVNHFFASESIRINPENGYSFMYFFAVKKIEKVQSVEGEVKRELEA